jgi:dihydrofolate reductase
MAIGSSGIVAGTTDIALSASPTGWPHGTTVSPDKPLKPRFLTEPHGKIIQSLVGSTHRRTSYGSKTVSEHAKWRISLKKSDRRTAYRTHFSKGVQIMRKLTLQMQTSVDGFVGRAGKGPGWQVWDWGPSCPWDDQLKARFNAVFHDVDTILLSRKIVEGGYLDNWSQFARDYRDNPDFVFAQRIVDARKIVFSKALQQTKRAGTELARRTLVEEVNAIKEAPGRNLIAFGGAGFASSLIAHGLVDEYQFYVNPVALGEGLSIFDDGEKDFKLALIEAESYACGIVVARYSPCTRASAES